MRSLPRAKNSTENCMKSKSFADQKEREDMKRHSITGLERYDILPKHPRLRKE